MLENLSKSGGSMVYLDPELVTPMELLGEIGTNDVPTNPR